MSFTFAQPWWLMLLVILPVLAWLKGRHGTGAAFLYSSVDLVKSVSGARRSRAGSWLSALRWLALALLIVALARPQLGQGLAKVTASGVDMVVALDLSGSMVSEDEGFTIKGQQVNRLELAKDVLAQFIGRRSSDRIGLVAFAGMPYVAAPITLDHDFLLQNLERLNLGTIEDGTAIGSALATCLSRLSELKSKSKIVILMTDGQNNAGKVPPMTAAEAAQTLGIKVYTIGVGTRGIAKVPRRNVFGQKVYQKVEVDVDEDTLKAIAQKTGGKYYRADSSETLRAIYEDIDKLEKTTVEVKKYQRYEELFGWLVVPALSLVLLELILGQTVFRRLP